VVASWSDHEAQNFGLATTLDYEFVDDNRHYLAAVGRNNAAHIMRFDSDYGRPERDLDTRGRLTRAGFGILGPTGNRPPDPSETLWRRSSAPAMIWSDSMANPEIPPLPCAPAPHPLLRQFQTGN
jgi:hypothetical protein